MSFALVFPGQGSQSLGMMNKLALCSTQVQATFAEASAILTSAPFSASALNVI